MYDIEFYMKSYDFLKNAQEGKIQDRDTSLALLESYRSREPVVYNIETTNACNMVCTMCPRTTMMTRPIKTIDRKVFDNVVSQLNPFPESTWAQWERFVVEKYGIRPDDMSENHFFLYVIPKVIQLHGYGDPLLDMGMAQHVKLLTSRGLQTYFSCNPANINIEKTLQMFENGLSYIKYSIESVDDEEHKAIRGDASNFSEAYERIIRLLELKKTNGFQTQIIITMLDLNRKNQTEDYRKLRAAFAGKDVYIYLKSEDQQWYRTDFHGTKSVHWSEICKHPWMSMTIKSNGEAAMCMEDFNNEIVLGDVKKESLSAIWNGERYQTFRENHFDLTPCLKCTERCDMAMIGERLEGRTHGDE